MQRERPAPIVGIEAAHDRVSDALARRGDRFSQLLSRAVRDERQGSVLMTTSGLTREEHRELARLTPAAHEDFGLELAATMARLRDLITAGDPFFILVVVQDLNRFVPVRTRAASSRDAGPETEEYGALGSTDWG